jgi:hypothetical protein
VIVPVKKLTDSVKKLWLMLDSANAVSLGDSSTRNPNHWDMLAEEDRKSYLQLQLELTAPIFSNQRSRSAAQFEVLLGKIKAYVIQGNKTDSIRAFVCGIHWIPGALAVNMRQMQVLTSKCKSSLNGSLTHLGYTRVPPSDVASTRIRALFPWIDDHIGELRSWTLRSFVSQENSIESRARVPAPEQTPG